MKKILAFLSLLLCPLAFADYNPGQNFTNINVTGGIVGGVSGAGNSWNTTSLLGQTYLGVGSVTTYGNGSNFGFGIYTVPVTGGKAFKIDTTQSWQVITLTGSTTGHPNEAFTLSGAPPFYVTRFSLLVYNSDSVLHTPTFWSSFSLNRGSTSTSVVIQPSTYALLTWYYDGTNYYLLGDPVYLNNLVSKATPVTADVVAIGDSAASYVTKQATISSLPFQHSLTFVVQGNGTALTTGTQTAYIMAGYNGTITKWKLTAAPASSNISFDIFRIASASSGLNVLPTATIVGTGTKPSVSTGIEAYGTPSDWVAGGGSITLAENDVLTAKVNTTSTTTYATITIYYQ